MIRLALVLAVFLGFGVASVAQAEPDAATEQSVPEPTAPAEQTSESAEAPRSEPRWVPRQGRRSEEAGPAVTPYPVLFTPTGIPNLGF